jgi:SAM-dependent methyltransferase
MDVQIICPFCLLSAGKEHPLKDLTCLKCGVTYPIVDGVPVLIADRDVRESILNRNGGGNPRTKFYQSETAYLRPDLTANQDLERALGTSLGRGLVLEIGSGAGTLTRMGGSDYCGLDYSLYSLHKFLPGQRRLCASAEAVPLPSASCRFIFSIATFEHVPDPSLAFAEIDRVLSPGGSTYLAPAWHCRDWMADGLPVRPYRDLTWPQKLRKASIPLRNSLLYRGLCQIPWRVWRRAAVKLKGVTSELRYQRLEANYEVYWTSDSDACSSIDSHEGILFFESRGYEILLPSGGVIAHLGARGGAIVVRKPFQ